jgi:hypothetical protein
VTFYVTHNQFVYSVSVKVGDPKVKNIIWKLPSDLLQKEGSVRDGAILSPDNDDKRKLEGEENDDYKPDNFSPHHHHRKLLCHDHEAFQASPHAKPQRRFFSETAYVAHFGQS